MTDPDGRGAGDLVTIQVDGAPMDVPSGASLAAVLALRGVDGLRRSEPSARMRGVFCGMGSCHDCAVSVDGVIGVRSCLTPVASGMNVRTGCSDAPEATS